ATSMLRSRYIPRYIRSFEKKKCYSPGVRSLKKMFDILSNTSASKHRRKMKPPSFDSSCRDESNGSGFILLRPLDAEIFGKTSKIRHFYICDTAPFDVLPNTSAYSGRRRMKPLPFDSSRHDESNDGGFIFLRCLDAEVFDKMSNIFLRNEPRANSVSFFQR